MPYLTPNIQTIGGNELEEDKAKVAWVVALVAMVTVAIAVVVGPDSTSA